MSLKVNTLVFFSLLTSILVSCSDDTDDPISGNGTEAKISAGISNMTRAHDAQWDENDAIGLAMLIHGGTEIINDVFNYHYYTPTSSGQFIPSGSTIFFPQDNRSVNFRAYYPYKQGLTRDMLIPISVADQTTPTQIDFMSAEHLSGFSKSDPNVHLRFHHRLTKVIFKLRTGEGEEYLPLNNMGLKIQGMKTTGTYDLINEALTINNNSQQDITIPQRGTLAERYGIVLPRTAGSGVNFNFTAPNGEVFNAAMSDTLNLKSGYKYTFYVTMEGNSVSISVDIQDWIEGSSTFYDIFGINTPAGESNGVSPGDQIAIYLKKENSYNLLDTFTYNTDLKWYPKTAVYWEDITTDPAQVRASMRVAEPLNNTQLPDILIADELSVARNTGANLVLRHAASKVEVELTSSTFTQDDLDNAIITLPGYLSGAYEEKGVFISGSQRNNILVDRTDKATGVAIIQPQSVSPNATIVNVRINNRDYPAYTTIDGFIFQPGTAYKLVVNLSENAVTVSVQVIDWTPGGTSYYEALEVSTPAGETTGVSVGDIMNVYLNEGTDYSFLSAFTYSGNNRWAANPIVYWDNIVPDPAPMRSSIIASPALNPTQMADILTSAVVNVPRNTGANFTLRHAGSKIIVGLLSNTFTDEQLRSATIILPNYETGGSAQNGAFVAGTGHNNITVDRTDPLNGIAIFQPQTIDAGDPIIRVTINGKNYTANAANAGFTYNAGTAYTMIVTLNEDAVTVSANVVDWSTDEVDLTASEVGVAVDGATGVLDQEKMNVYTSMSPDRDLLSTYTYTLGTNTWTADPIVYWDNLPSPLTFYASILRTPKYNDTQLDDYLLAAPIQGTASNGIAFSLSHPASQVVVQLTSSDNSFSAQELGNMTFTLPNYNTGATIVNGIFTAGTSKGDITVAKNVGTDGNSAIAIIQPQTISAGTEVITITNPSSGRNYNVTYTAAIEYKAGVSTILSIDMKKTAVSLSAKVTDWTAGSTIDMVPKAINISGTLNNTAEFFENKTIHVYKLGTDFQSLAYTYLPQTTGYTWQGTQLYWDDQQNQTLNVTGVYYPNQGLIPTTIDAGHTTFAWDLPTNQSGGYNDYDLLMNHQLLNSPAYVNFVFTHVLSKVRIQLTSKEFTTAELTGATVVINNVATSGIASLATGSVTASSIKQTVTPYTNTNGSTYSALVMPQTIPQNTVIVTITLRGYPNTPFTGTLQGGLTLVAGKESVITVDLKKTEIELSSTLEDWQTGNSGSVVIE